MSQLSHAQFPLRRHPDLLVDHRRARSAAVAEPRGANAESRDRLRWPASFRNGGRHQIGTAADIKSESPAGLRRNSHLSIVGCDMEVSGPVISSLALLLHEFATNSVKYGALSATTGQIKVHCADRGETVVLTWSEHGGPPVAP